MNSFSQTLMSLCLIYSLILTTVYCIDNRVTGLTQDEIIALTRDHFARPDPDALLSGFFPVWAAIQFCLSGFFLIIAILSGLCYLLGFRPPPEERNK